MLIGGRTPNKILFAKGTGRVYQQDFCPIYDTRLVLEKNESVPFRLTRNLATLFTPFGVEGNFVTTLSVSAQVRISSSRLWASDSRIGKERPLVCVPGSLLRLPVAPGSLSPKSTWPWFCWYSVLPALLLAQQVEGTASCALVIDLFKLLVHCFHASLFNQAHPEL